MTFEFINPRGEQRPPAAASPDAAGLDAAPDGDAGPAAPSLFDRLGGREAVERVVDAFYARIEADEELRPLFPPEMAPGREKQKLFMEQWLGGEPRYSVLYGDPRLRRRHFPFVISERTARRWLRHMTEALRECAVAEDVVGEMLKTLAPLAHHMINEGDDVPREPLADSFLR